jgi:hypothetical protein
MPSAPIDVPLGTFGVVRTGGWFAMLIRLLTRSRVNHAFIVTDPASGQIVEMAPRKGASFTTGAEYPDAIYARGLVLTDVQRDAVARAALGLEARHVRYGFLDIANLFLADTVGLHPRWLLRFLQRSDRMVCSQSVDWCYQQAGVHLFTDGRWPGDVDPGDLETLIASNGWGWSAHPGVLAKVSPVKVAKVRRSVRRLAVRAHRGDGA